MLDTLLAEADLAAAVGRTAEEKALQETLGRTAPNDPRVRLRASVTAFNGFGGALSSFEAVRRAREVLLDPPPSRRGADDLSWELGLVATIGSVLLTNAAREVADPGAFLRDKASPVFADLKSRAEELAKHDPARAAAVLFVSDRVMSMSRATGSPLDLLMDEARRSLPALEALVEAHPLAADVWKLFFAAAVFVGDADRAHGIVARAPPPGLDGVRVHVVRAMVASLYAASSLRPDWLELARSTAAVIPELDDDALEGRTAALRADAESLAAMLSEDVERWRRAARLYEAALPRVKSTDRPRILNNLGVAAARLGRTAEARRLLSESVDGAGARSWVPTVNGVFTQTSETHERRDHLTALETRFGEADVDVPLALGAWLVALSSDAEAKRKRAETCVKVLDGSFYRGARDYVGVEVERALSVSIGVSTAARGHHVDVQVDALPWLVRSRRSLRRRCARSEAGAVCRRRRRTRLRPCHDEGPRSARRRPWRSRDASRCRRLLLRPGSDEANAPCELTPDRSVSHAARCHLRRGLPPLRRQLRGRAAASRF